VCPFRSCQGRLVPCHSRQQHQLSSEPIRTVMDMFVRLHFHPGTLPQPEYTTVSAKISDCTCNFMCFHPRVEPRQGRLCEELYSFGSVPARRVHKSLFFVSSSRYMYSCACSVSSVGCVSFFSDLERIKGHLVPCHSRQERGRRNQSEQLWLRLPDGRLHFHPRGESVSQSESVSPSLRKV
jgi:hypothetical protein